MFHRKHLEESVGQGSWEGGFSLNSEVTEKEAAGSGDHAQVSFLRSVDLSGPTLFDSKLSKNSKAGLATEQVILFRESLAHLCGLRKHAQECISEVQ